MKNIFKNNKYFVYIVIVFLLGSMLYGLNKLKGNEGTDKEVVNIVLPESEITQNLKELVDKFNIENQDIEIKFETYAIDYINVAITKIVNQKNIDIFEYFDRFLIDKNELQNLDDLKLDFSNIDNNSIVKFNNEPIGVRYGNSVPKMVINKDIIEKAGIKDFSGINSFDELIDIATKIKNNVPGVMPIGLSSASISDMLMMFGPSSAMESDVYSTFWNYKKGKYTFTEATETLEIYRELYNKGLINEDFNSKEFREVRDDFINEKVAITFTQSNDNGFLKKGTEDINIAVEDIPSFNNNNLNKRYYDSNSRILVVRNYDKEVDNLDIAEPNVKNHKEAVKKVYEWLNSEDVKNQIMKSDIELEFSASNNGKNFKFENLDPSPFISIDKNIIRDTFTELIKGENDMNSELIKLEEEIDRRIENDDEKMEINLDLYKEQ
ncbi:MAG: ABC transporter substrate-binding protein [Clostridium sp.]